jgi:hypothetical protein
MNDELTDDQVRAALVARSAGGPSPDLADRIRAAVTGTKQERPAMRLVGLAPLTRTRYLVVAAVLGVSVAVLAGSLLLGGGPTKPDPKAIVPTDAPPTDAPPTAVPPTAVPAFAPSNQPTDAPATAVPQTPPATVEPSSAPSLVPNTSFGPGSVVTVWSAQPLALYSTLRTINGPRLPGLDKIAEVGTGTSMYMAAGPVSVVGSGDAEDWYLVKPFDQDPPGRSFPLGWVRAIESRSPTMSLGSPRCLVGNPTPANVRDLTAVGALACFGGQDFKITGRVACTPNASRPTAMQHLASGPDWLDDGRFCAFRSDDGEPYFEIFEFSTGGLSGNWQAQDLVVTGHLADLGWHACVGREGPPYVTDAEAEFECRLGFHFTRVALAPVP